MTIISWNVNGIRAVVKKGFIDFVKKENPDILCLQEIKINYELTNLTNDTNLKDYKMYWNFAKKPGYSGTAIFVKKFNSTDATSEVGTSLTPGVKKVIYGIAPTLGKVGAPTKSVGGDEKFDNEGRVLTLEFEKFYLINAYFPHTRRALERLDFKLEFNEKFLEFTKNLTSYPLHHKPIIIAGDLNVAHKEIDLANPKENQKNAGFLPQERAFMDKLLASGYVDTFRQFTKEGGHYTWWSHFANSRARNIGWRIDYFIVSETFKNKIQSSKILPQISGSDHAPVVMEIDL